MYNIHIGTNVIVFQGSTMTEVVEQIEDLLEEIKNLFSEDPKNDLITLAKDTITVTITRDGSEYLGCLIFKIAENKTAKLN